MIDDWAAIVPVATRDRGRVRRSAIRRASGIAPGSSSWNYLQWHTFGGPGHLVVPSVWGVLRVATFVFGLVGAAFVLLGRSSIRPGDDLIRALMAGGAALVVTTMPQPAIDLARYGPQEPLMVGLMCGGGALVAIASRRALVGTGVRGADMGVGRHRTSALGRWDRSEGDVGRRARARALPLDGHAPLAPTSSAGSAGSPAGGLGATGALSTCRSSPWSCASSS